MEMDSLVDTPVQQDEVKVWMFFRALKASQLLTPQEWERWQLRAETMPFDNVLREMQDEGLLTPYQIEKMRSGNPARLVLGQYRILDELGKGGCGSVYKAQHRLMDRIVALKMINADAKPNDFQRDLFIREVVATTRLNHPNIASAYDANEDDGQIYFAMEYIDGPTLQSLVCSQGPLPIWIACSYFHQAAEALHHAHEKGIVHRDIKPANIMLAYDRTKGSSPDDLPNVVKILDFGLCRLAMAKPRLLATIPCDRGAIVGTPAFIAPEQIDDLHRADARSDLYSLGCTFYYALTGSLPFDGTSTKATLKLHQEHSALPVGKRREAIPPSLAAIISRLMAKKPSQRYQSASDLIDALSNFILGGGLVEGGSPHPESVMPAMPVPAAKRSSQQIVALKCLPQSIPADPPHTGANDPTPKPSKELLAADNLLMLWSEWRHVVEELALGRASTIAPNDYKVLYRNLLAGVRNSVDRPYGLTTLQSQRLQELIEPWVSVTSLENLDPDSLAELMRECVEFESRTWSHAGAGLSVTVKVVVGIGIMLATLVVVALASTLQK